MKNLTILMTVKANGNAEAELIAQRELMNLAMRTGAMMGCGNGNAKQVSNNTYEVTATVSMDINGNINEIVQNAQREWNEKKEIISSMIFVNESEREDEDDLVRCDCCGVCIDDGTECIINPETENECVLCDECYCANENIAYCEYCNTSFDKGYLIENPVSKRKNICPYCGEIVED